MMNLFETLVHPDREENLERAEVAHASNLLQVGEFQFLQLSYQEWFGEEMPAPLVDELFSTYMFYNEVPYWARHYARSILALDKKGKLDERDPAYHRYDHEYQTKVPRGVFKFCVSAAIVLLFIGGSLLIGHLVAEKGTSVLPPYFEQEELSPQKTRLSP
jgi:hypothetical protein